MHKVLSVSDGECSTPAKQSIPSSLKLREHCPIGDMAERMPELESKAKIYETTSSSKDTELQMPAQDPYKVVPVTLRHGLGRDSGSPYC